MPSSSEGSLAFQFGMAPEDLKLNVAQSYLNLVNPGFQPAFFVNQILQMYQQGNQPSLPNFLIPITQQTTQNITEPVENLTLKFWMNFLKQSAYNMPYKDTINYDDMPALDGAFTPDSTYSSDWSNDDQMPVIDYYPRLLSKATTKRRRREKRARMLSLTEPITAEPATDSVPDAEWEEKVVEYCKNNPIYQNWKHGKVGLDSLINPNGARKFPQPVWKAPHTSKTLFNHTAKAKGQTYGTDETWKTLSHEEQEAYFNDVIMLQREVKVQVAKGWIVPEKRLRSKTATRKREMEMFGNGGENSELNN